MEGDTIRIKTRRAQPAELARRISIRKAIEAAIEGDLRTLEIGGEGLSVELPAELSSMDALRSMVHAIAKKNHVRITTREEGEGSWLTLYVVERIPAVPAATKPEAVTPLVAPVLNPVAAARLSRSAGGDEMRLPSDDPMEEPTPTGNAAVESDDELWGET